MAAVVADNGGGTCNTEFAGDDAPRVELPSIIDRPKMPGIMVDTEPTARVFPAWTMESNMSASFCVNAWICAPQATDRDLESVFVKRKVNAWICACQATDRDLEGVSK